MDVETKRMGKDGKPLKFKIKDEEEDEQEEFKSGPKYWPKDKIKDLNSVKPYKEDDEDGKKRNTNI